MTQDFYRFNHEAAKKFVSPEQQGLRRRFMDENVFRPAASLCMDGRVQGFMHAIGVPIGVIELYRSAGAKHGPENLMHMRRMQDAVQNGQDYSKADGRPDPHATLLFQTVHYSHSAPAVASCAAWEHDTAAAMHYMQELSEAYHASWPGKVIAFPLLIDTDLDAMTVIGFQGEPFATRELLGMKGDPLPSRLLGMVVDRLVQLFPSSWHPLALLDMRFQKVFHQELALYLLHNLEVIRKVQTVGREPEMLDHQERLVFIGRHADWMFPEQHNSVFLVDDIATPEELSLQIGIALRYVVRNVILDACTTGEKAWRIPFLFNVPHVDRDLDATKVYMRALLQKVIRPAITASFAGVREWLLHSQGIPQEMRDQVASMGLGEFLERISLCLSTSRKSTRQFVPFT